MRRAGVTLALLVLPGAALSEGPALAFMTKFTPAVTPSLGARFVSLDASRKTALIASESPEIWGEATLGVQYYFRSFAGLPLERIQMEKLKPWITEDPYNDPADVYMSGDGNAAYVRTKKWGSSGGFGMDDSIIYIYDRQKKAFYPSPLPQGIWPIEIVGGNRAIIAKDGKTVTLDLNSGEQTPLADGVYSEASYNGRYLFSSEHPTFNNPDGTLKVFDVAKKKAKSMKLKGAMSYWTAPDRKTVLYYRDLGGGQLGLVKLDPFSQSESVYPLPGGISFSDAQVHDYLGGRVLLRLGFPTTMMVWNLSDGSLTPLEPGRDLSWHGRWDDTARFLSAKAGLLSTSLEVGPGDLNEVSDVATGTIGGPSWRPAIAPLRGNRYATQPVLAPDNRFSVAFYMAMGKEAGGKPYGFLRTDLTTGAAQQLAGRAEEVTSFKVSSGGTFAALVPKSAGKLIYRDLATGAEREVPLGGRSLYSYEIAPQGDRVAYTTRMQGEPLRLFVWSPTSVSESPLPSGSVDVPFFAFSNGRIIMATTNGSGDWRCFFGPADGSRWKSLALVSGQYPAGASITEDGSIGAIAQMSKAGVGAGYTRTYGMTDGKPQNTVDRCGYLSFDGKWVIDTFYSYPGNGKAFLVATGAQAYMRLPRATDPSVAAVGPWLALPMPYTVSGLGQPVAYRPTVLRIPKFEAQAWPTVGGGIRVSATVTKAGLENASHKIYFRLDGGSWGTSDTDVFTVATAEGPHRLEIYVEDDLKRRSANTEVYNVFTDATPPTVSDVTYAFTDRNVTIRAVVTDNRTWRSVKFGLAKAGEAYRWVDANSDSQGLYATFTKLARKTGYRIQVEATDAVGNKTLSTEIAFVSPQ